MHLRKVRITVISIEAFYLILKVSYNLSVSMADLVISFTNFILLVGFCSLRSKIKITCNCFFLLFNDEINELLVFIDLDFSIVSVKKTFVFR